MLTSLNSLTQRELYKIWGSGLQPQLRSSVSQSACASENLASKGLRNAALRIGVRQKVGGQAVNVGWENG